MADQTFNGEEEEDNGAQSDDSIKDDETSELLTELKELKRKIGIKRRNKALKEEIKRKMLELKKASEESELTDKALINTTAIRELNRTDEYKRLEEILQLSSETSKNKHVRDEGSSTEKNKNANSKPVRRNKCDGKKRKIKAFGETNGQSTGCNDIPQLQIETESTVTPQKLIRKNSDTLIGISVRPNTSLELNDKNYLTINNAGTYEEFSVSCSLHAIRKESKSNSERCRRYREKKKHTDLGFMENENIRQKNIRINKTQEQINNDREKAKLRMRNLRERRKHETTTLKDSNIENSEQSEIPTSSQESSCSEHQTKKVIETFVLEQNTKDKLLTKDSKNTIPSKDEISSFVNPDTMERYSDEDGQRKTFSETSIKTHACPDKFSTDIKTLKRYRKYLYPVFCPGELKQVPWSPKMAIDEFSWSMIPELPRELNITKKRFLPVKIKTDGNCLPRCGSLLAFGTEDHHEEIRQRIALEMIRNEEQYLSLKHIARANEKPENIVNAFTMYSKHYKSGTVINMEVTRDVYAKEIEEIVQPNTFMGIWQICALSTLLSCPIFSLYPENSSTNLRNDLHRKINPLINGNASQGPLRFILWTRSNKTKSNWDLNHFVPLLQNMEDRLSIKYITNALTAMNSRSLMAPEAESVSKTDNTLIKPTNENTNGKTVKMDAIVPNKNTDFQAYKSDLQKRLSNGLQYNIYPEEPCMTSHHFPYNPSFQGKPLYSRSESELVQSQNVSLQMVPGERFSTNNDNVAEVNLSTQRIPQLFPCLPIAGMSDVSNIQSSLPSEILHSNMLLQQTTYLKDKQKERFDFVKPSLVSSFDVEDRYEVVNIDRFCFIPGNRLLFTDIETDCLHICSVNGSNFRSIMLGYRPWDVTLYDKNQVLVAAGNERISVH